MRRHKLTAVFLVVLGALVGWGAFWYVAAAPLAPLHVERPVVAVFAGDIMLDRQVAVAMRQRGPASLFASSSALFADADLRVANLEGTITTNPSVAQVNHDVLAFTFDPVLAHLALAPLGLTAASLANNHSYDFGIDGYQATRSYLAQWGTVPFGSPYNRAGLLSAVLTAQGKRVCLVGYMQLFDPATSTTVAELHALRGGCWKLIVFAHWGVEYAATSTAAQRAAAHEFVDAGADLVVGAHPHVIEPLEVYRGVPILYSLGNFMFDQNFSWAVQHGLVLRVAFYDNKTRLTMVPVSVANERSSLAEGPDAAQALAAAGLPAGVDTLLLP